MGKNCEFWIQVEGNEGASGSQLFKWCDFHPADSNDLQSFLFPGHTIAGADKRDLVVSGFKIVFGDSTDFYGRITVYQLGVLVDASSDSS